MGSRGPIRHFRTLCVLCDLCVKFLLRLNACFAASALFCGHFSGLPISACLQLTLPQNEPGLQCCEPDPVR
jgi:hypothetical protein